MNLGCEKHRQFEIVAEFSFTAAGKALYLLKQEVLAGLRKTNVTFRIDSTLYGIPFRYAFIFGHVFMLIPNF